VPGLADYIARGLKCPTCGTGFAPVKVKGGFRGSPDRERARSIVGWLVLWVIGFALVPVFWAAGFPEGAVFVTVLLCIGLVIGLYKLILWLMKTK
jgi:hypothetical protein